MIKLISSFIFTPLVDVASSNRNVLINEVGDHDHLFIMIMMITMITMIITMITMMITMIMMIMASAGCSSFLKTITESAAAQMRLQWSSVGAARTKRN